MKQKKQFIAPKAKVQKCDVAGIICASGGAGGGSGSSAKSTGMEAYTAGTTFDWY